MNALQSYPAYKDPGVALLGAVPEHWEVRSLGTFGRFFKGSGGTKADETGQGVPCIRYGDLYTRHRFHITASKACVAPHRAGAYTPVRYGDVLFAGSGETLEEIGKSAVNLIRGSAVCGGDVIVFRPAIDVDAEFIGWSSDCRHAASQKSRMGRGITVMHIYSSDLKYLAIPLPPLPEQTAIARFLDDADRRLRRYIRAKERLIELLEEERRTTIHEAVTGRIDVRTGRPYPTYKDSGVEWLGEVPEHWEVRRLGATTERIVAGTWGSDPTGRNDIVCVRVADFDRKRLGVDLRKPTLRSVPAGERQGRLLEAGDLLLEKSGGGDLQPVGTVVQFDHEEDAVASNFIGRMRVRGQYSARYVLYLHSVLYAIRITVRSIKQTTGIQNLDVGAYLSESIPLPPLSEQTAIARFIDAADRRRSARRGTVARQIALLREYRTRLIADVVTGKLDVREAAATRPETDRLADDRDRAGTITTEPNLQASQYDMAKEASP